MRAIQKDGTHPNQAPILNGATVDHGRMANRDLVTDRRGVRVPHHVNHGAILHVGSAPDPDPMHIASNDDDHPDAAFFADLDVADNLGAVVDVGCRMNAGHSPAVGPEHSACIIVRGHIMTGVIAGWQRGVVGMKVGGQRRLIIPPDLAYGSTGSGPIPPNATLVFDIGLLGVQ
jgi:hypothetical protein